MPSKKQKQKRKEKRDELYLANKWRGESFTFKKFQARQVYQRIRFEKNS
jgi:hypothetical protein